MFICEPCWRERTTDQFWWGIALKSRGGCEVCGQGAVCADIHHSHVPFASSLPPSQPKEHGE